MDSHAADAREVTPIDAALVVLDAGGRTVGERPVTVEFVTEYTPDELPPDAVVTAPAASPPAGGPPGPPGCPGGP